MSLPSISTHTTLEALVRFPRHTLRVSEAAEVLERDRATVSAACKHGDIPSRKDNFKGRGNRCTYTIQKSDLILWLWNNQSGDRSMLRAAMEELCPRVLRAIERSSGADKARPKNVLAFEHPDLFQTAPEQQQSA